MVIPALLAGDIAGFLFGPFRQPDIRCQRGRNGPWPEDYQIVSRQLDLVERRAVIFDDLPQVQPELLERGVAACLVLKVCQPDLPLWLCAAVLPGNLIQAALQGAAKAEVVFRDADHLVGLDRTHQPVSQDDFAVVEAPFSFFPHDKAAFVDQAADADLFPVSGPDVCLELGALQALKGVFEAFVFPAIGVAVRSDHQLASAEPDPLPDGFAPVLSVHQLADAEDQDVFVLDGRQPKPGRDDFQAVLPAPVDQMAHVGLRGQREQRVFHRRHVILGHDIGDVEDEEVFLWVSIWK